MSRKEELDESLAGIRNLGFLIIVYLGSILLTLTFIGKPSGSDMYTALLK